MRRFLILLIVLLPAWPALAEEEAGTTCDLHALVDPDDAGLRATYDGLRKGLEIARLPRVCRHDPDPERGGIAGFLERRAMAAAPRREAGKRVDPIFAIGDASSAAVAAATTTYPSVMAVVRYTLDRKPIVALPVNRAGAVVYADLPVERIVALLRTALARPQAVLLLRQAETIGRIWDPIHAGSWTPGEGLQEQLRQARATKVPVISDNRAHFGLGAMIVIVPRHDLLGKAAADEGRKLRADPKYVPTTRVVPGFEVWVDLAAADAIDYELPLSFLARADRLRKGRPRAAQAKGSR